MAHAHKRPRCEMISAKIQTLSEDGGGQWASATEPACARQIELLPLSLAGAVRSVGSTVSAYPPSGSATPALQASTAPPAPPCRSKQIFPQ